MGLSIVAAKGVGKDKLGIYVKAVVDNGAAHHDGKLKLFKLDQTCSNLLKLAQTCSNLLKLAQTCPNLFKLAQTCSNLLKLAQTCSN